MRFSFSGTRDSLRMTWLLSLYQLPKCPHSTDQWPFRRAALTVWESLHPDHIMTSAGEVLLCLVFSRAPLLEFITFLPRLITPDIMPPTSPLHMSSLQLSVLLRLTEDSSFQHQADLVLHPLADWAPSRSLLYYKYREDQGMIRNGTWQ